MKCQNCGAEFNGRFCDYCGSELTQPINATPNIVVPNITIVNNNNTSNVNNNGYIRSHRTVFSKKSKRTAIFLCCLSFVGLGGLHRFYVGKTASGVCHLLTIGFMWIGTIVDLISLSKGTFTDGKGLPLR